MREFLLPDPQVIPQKEKEAGGCCNIIDDIFQPDPFIKEHKAEIDPEDHDQQDPE
jgi:hypothetical protein